MKPLLNITASIALGSLLQLSVLHPAYADQSTTADDEINVFAAFTYGAGFRQQSGLNNTLQDYEEYQDYDFLQLEARIDYKGFFLETTGKSQVKIDGQFSGQTIGYNLHNTDNWTYDIVAQQAFGKAVFGFNTPEERLALVRERDYRLGLRATGHFDNLYAQLLVLPHSFRDEIGGFDTSFSIRQNWQYRNLNFYNSVGVRYRSGEILDYYFGLDTGEARAIRDLIRNDDNGAIVDDYFVPYEVSGAFSVSGSVGFEYPLNEHWVFGGFFDYEYITEEIQESPLYVGDKWVNAFGLTITYVF